MLDIFYNNSAGQFPVIEHRRVFAQVVLGDHDCVVLVQALDEQAEILVVPGLVVLDPPADFEVQFFWQGGVLMAQDENEICADCGSTEPAVKASRGSGWVELFLYVLMIIPGVIYSLWRRARSRFVCSYCGNPSMVPVHDPRAQKITRLMKGREVSSKYYQKPMGVTELRPKTIRNLNKKKKSGAGGKKPKQG